MFLLATLSLLPFSGTGITISTDRCNDHDVVYVVEYGDNLHHIGRFFGHDHFWESIYIANADQIANPNRIFSGQVLRIPYKVAKYSETGGSVDEFLENPFCNFSILPISSIDERYLKRYSLSFLRRMALDEEKLTSTISSDTDSDNTLTEDDIEAFRKAFDAVVSNNENTEDQQRQSERNLLTEIDGMIHDETRSKIGRDFYDVFYTFWQTPPNARNFSIRIIEHPAPSLGTIVSVQVNENETFRMRLQPRYDFIEEASRYAVRNTYLFLRDNQHEFVIY